MNNIMNIAISFIVFGQLVKIITICEQEPKIDQIVIKLNI
jgi:hypothetical protein